MTRLLLRAGLRYHIRHRWQLTLALLGVALGVAVVVAVDVAAGSARRALELSTAAVTGRATHEIVGGPSGLPDTLYVRLRTTHASDSIAPVIDRYVRLADRAGRILRVLGVDPFAEAPFRPYVRPASERLDLALLLTQRTLLLSSATAASIGVRSGDTVNIAAGAGVPVPAVIAGLLQPEDDLSREALSDVALADIATAQELTGAIGVLDRIELRLADDQAGAAALERIAATLPTGTRIRATAVRTGATARLTRAFETNLAALALVALVFAMFLIYNSVTFSVVQRRAVIALLRAQGVTAREIFALIIGEAALLGLVATAVGIPVGLVLGRELVGLVARTVNDLYFAVSVTTLRLDRAALLKAALLGIGATIAAALPPAREAVTVRPRVALARATLERAARRAAPRLAGAAALAAVTAAALLASSRRSLPLGFAALFIIILAAALVTPAATLLTMRVLTPLSSLAGPVGRLAARGVAASLSRTAPAIAALAVALAVGIAVTVMIGSFRNGVIRWLETTLQADIYLAAPGLGPARTDAALDDALLADLRRDAAVADLTAYRHLALLLDDDFTRVIAVRLAARQRAAFEVLDGDRATLWAAFARGSVLISEPLSFRRGLRAGDTITLPTDRGPRAVPIAGVFRDYASEHGVLFIDRAAYDLLWDDDVVNSIAVFLHDDASAGDALQRIRALPSAAGANVRANHALRTATLEVFDRTFVITGVLRLLALLVAFVGVTGALMALQLERAREVAVLRVTGLTPAQVWATITAQTGFMGLVAAVLAVPLGIVMAWAMVHIINRRAFGWTFAMEVTAQPLLQALAVGAGAAVLAGVLPAWRMARSQPADALREE